MLQRETVARPTGVVYTPPEVAAAMVRVALAPLIRDRTSAELCALRICDFAIGEGVFLVEVVDVLAGAIAAAWHAEGTHGDARTAAARCIFGVDVDAEAVATARRVVGCDGLRVADALELDWAAEFPDGFDAIVGNPPYIRQEWLAAHKPALQKFASYDGVADLYVYFIELAHRIARPNGRYCLITPNKWLTTAYGRGLRGFLARAGSVEGVVDLARLQLFADADAFPCIVWGTVGTPSSQPIHAARVRSGSVAAALAGGDPHARERWRDEPWHIDEPADRALIERLERRWPALGDVLDHKPMRGVVTGCNRAFVIDRSTRERILDEDPGAAKLVRPFVKGRDVDRWTLAPIERWILLVDRGVDLAEHPGIAAHLARFRSELEPRPPAHRDAWPGRKPGRYHWYELQDPVGALAASRSPRLLYQDIQSGPACALDRSGDVVPDTTCWIIASEDLYLLAVLNSSIYGWIAERRFPPALNGSVRPKLEYLRALPIPQPSDRTAIAALVENRLATSDAELDVTIDDAVLDTYELTRAERALVRPASGSRARRLRGSTRHRRRATGSRTRAPDTRTRSPSPAAPRVASAARSR